MKKYKINFKPSVEKDFKKISKVDIEKIQKRIAELADNPYPEGYIKLSGTEKLYRI